MARPDRALLLVLSLCLLTPWTAGAAGVQALFDLSSPGGGPFPSDRFTVPDDDHLTGLRVHMPKPDCGARPSDCADIDVINTLDGFNVQPRLSIPFSGPIDVTTVSSRTVFVVSLSDTLGGRSGKVVGINQVVWDPATNTLHAESDELLDQHTTYALVVTRGIRDAAGDPAEPAADFVRFRHDLNFGQTKDDDLKVYRRSLLEGLAGAHAAGVGPDEIAAVSVFTTQSATAVLEKIRDRIKASTPGPATMLGTFPLGSLAAIQWDRQVGTAPTFAPPSFLPLPALGIFPGAVGALAFGKYASSDFETAEKFIPPVGTRTGIPAVQRTNDVYFNLVLPAGTPPSGGWPVAIFGHGFTDSKQGAPLAVASSFAVHGIATIAVNVVGHGGGTLGTLTVVPVAGLPVTIPDGGRGIDQDGNGSIDSTEGVNAAPPRTIISNRDGLRQTVADLMQLVRVIETGGIPGLNASRIYYAGQSFGGIYGTKFLALEPSVRAGVVNVPGGPIIEIARLSPVFRGLVTLALARRVPPLLNVFPIAPPLLGFDESIPLRDQPAVISPAPGAMAIQEVIDNTEWVSQSGNPVAYAPYLRMQPLDGMEAKAVIVQFAKGDRTVPNPTTTAILRAGDLADRATYLRNDLVVAAIPGAPTNPHTFLTNIGVPSVASLAVAAQQQIAIFVFHDGAVVVDPDGAGPFFEVPIAGPLPEALSF